MKSRSIMTGLASVAALAATSAHAMQTTERACLTEPELQAVIATMMPEIISGIGGVCRPVLPAGAYLKRNGDALNAAFEAEARGADAAATAALLKIAGVKGNTDTMITADAFAELKRELGSSVAKAIPTRDCPAIDRLFYHMQSLSPANVAGAMGAIGAMVEAAEPEKGSKKKPGFPPICPITID